MPQSDIGDGNSGTIFLGGEASAGSTNPPDPVYGPPGSVYPFTFHVAFDINDDDVIDKDDDAADEDESAPGKFIALNDDDDDGDGTPDKDQIGPVPGENDLAKMSLGDYPAALDGHSEIALVVEEGADKVALYGDADRSNPVTTLSWTLGSQPDSIWVEAIDPSVSLADIKFLITLMPVGIAAGAEEPSKGTAHWVDLLIEGLSEEDEAVAPGTKVHINDDFDEGQDTTLWQIADYQPDPDTGDFQIVATDSDLLTAFVDVGPLAAEGLLEWDIGDGVKVWWEQQGEWVEVTDVEDYSTQGWVELRIEGMQIGETTVEVTFTPDGADPASDELLLDVYTGLKATGDRVTALVDLAEDATRYNLTFDADGNIWRQEAEKNTAAFSAVARGYLTEILESPKQTSVRTDNDSAFIVGSFEGEAIDTGDARVVFNAEPRAGAAFLMHELWEQFRKQVDGVEVYAVAHATALLVEYEVIGDANRVETLEPLPDHIGLHYKFQYDGGLVIEFDTLYGNPTIENLIVTRP